MKNNTMNRIAAYNSLIAEACTNYCEEFEYGFYANDATCTLAIMTSSSELEIVARYEGGYFFNGKYYETAKEVLDAAIGSYEVEEYGARTCRCSMEELLAYIDAHENDEEYDEDGLPIEEEYPEIIHRRSRVLDNNEEEDPDLI